tara:strand:+ start:2220 stop:3425 length:1206 start_codon:yes stop_codon:yes gene_type:complete
MIIPPFTLDRQYLEIGPEIENAVLKILKGGQFIGGDEIKKFEESFASLIGTTFAVGCNSGTDALVLALRALDIGNGDEVITTSFSFFATAEAISMVGASPVFVDINPKTFLLDINQIEKKINSRTKALMPVHLFGNAVDMNAIQSISRKYKLKIIEDCAQATCTKWNDKKVGSIGDIGCFSFFPTKNLGAAGDGGAITTSNKYLAQKIRELAVHGSPQRYHHSYVGYNSRLDAIQAAVLNIKLKSLSKCIDLRRKVANNYLKLIKSHDYLSLPENNTEYSYHTWNQFALRFKNNNFSLKEKSEKLFETDYKKYKSLRNFVKNNLYTKNINSIIYYPIPIHSQKAFQNIDFRREELIKTEKICSEILSLPMFPEITYEEQSYIVKNLNTSINHYFKEIQISA